MEGEFSPQSEFCAARGNPICYPLPMLKARIRKKAADAKRATAMLANVVTSIHALEDEDLLDLADIFAEDADATLSKIASAEMQRRNVSL